MNNKLGNIRAGFIFLALVLGAGTTFALPDQAKVFGIGAPLTAEDLPPGLVRSKLKSLPPQAREKALQWMQGFSFAQADLETLRIDPEGGVFYADTYLPEPVDDATAEAMDLPEAIAPADTFQLHSRPGASNVVYLDFDGHTITGTAWNSNAGTDPLIAKSFDPSGDGAVFSNDELARIGEIWHRVAEDMAPFDIDVTTEEPATFNSTTGRLLFTDDLDANGASIYPSPYSVGGVAYVNVFGRSNYHTVYSPALVFYTNLGSGFAPYNAEAGSHEFGHNLGLSHDGTVNTGCTDQYGQEVGCAYYSGHGSGYVSWGPIMGVGYYTNVTQWSKGEYTDANQTQDDLAIIDNYLGYREDDHGDTLANASPLSIEANGDVLVSNPETDPHNVYPDNKGIIEHRTDVDMFSMDVGAGSLSLTVTPAWDAFYRTAKRGANLDVEISLYDSGSLLLSTGDPVDETDATIATSVSAGRYYLQIDGVGNNVGEGYSDYGSLGEYFISGSVTPAVADDTPPDPNPMTWAVLPYATGENSISMTASTATDDFGFVEYNFLCTSEGSGCSDSGWQTATLHNATGLDAATSYSYRVQARDGSGNITGASLEASATTDAPDTTPPTPNPMTWATLPAATGENSITMTATTASDASGPVEYNFECAAGGAGCLDSGWQTAVVHDATGLQADTSYSYRVLARDAAGNMTAASPEAFATTDAPPPYIDHVATGETLVAGSVSGSYLDTQSDGGNAEEITERDSGGKPANRYSYLEHIWHIDVSPGNAVTLFANAWRSSDSSDGDNFVFAYSLNGSPYLDMFLVSSTDSINMESYALPGNANGTVSVRVRDTDRNIGNRDQDTINVDYLYIRSENAAGDPPAAPSGLIALASSSSQIDLLWTDNASDESGFKVERSTDGISNWIEVASISGTDVTSHTDTGLGALTTYYYRVAAYNGSGTSSYSDPASDTTMAGADINLTATVNKVRADYNVELIWSGAGGTTVDIYRNESLYETATNIDGVYTDSLGKKPNASYVYMVCEVAPLTDCSDQVTVNF